MAASGIDHIRSYSPINCVRTVLIKQNTVETVEYHSKSNNL